MLRFKNKFFKYFVILKILQNIPSSIFYIFLYLEYDNTPQFIFYNVIYHVLINDAEGEREQYALSHLKLIFF